MDAGDYFEGDSEGLRVFTAIASRIAEIGPAEVRVSKSEIAFRRKRGFAFVWRPDKYLKRAGVPAVLSIALPGRKRSARFKSVVHPSPRVWMHHLELRGVEEVDAQVTGWLGEAYDAAAQARSGSRYRRRSRTLTPR